MDARRVMQWIVAILFIIVWTLCNPVFASPVRIYGGNFNLPIPSPDDPNSEYGMGLMDDAIIAVPGSFRIRDVNVAVGLTHGAFFDLEIILQSPAGTSVVLNPAGNTAFIVKDEGGLRPIGGSAQWLFDDEADVSILQAAEPYSGPYQPAELLSVFYGESIFGEWKIQIRDCWTAHIGELESVELIFTIPEPATVLFLAVGAGLATLFRPR